MTELLINGEDLTPESFHAIVVEGRQVALDPKARERVQQSRAVVEELVRRDEVAYAITTGVGKLSDVHIAPAQNRELQLNLIRSHAAGVGEPLSPMEARGMMLLRANSLAKGYSGVRSLIIDTLCQLLNSRVHPVIPSQGSVGASGDLAPLAHLALVLVGEGEAWYEEARLGGKDALQRASVTPIALEAKEAISLINGTQAMLSVGLLALLAAETLVDSADVIGALSLDALKGTLVAMDERIHLARPHAGQIRSASNLKRLLANSEIRESHKDCGRVQDAYSLRCIPQVHGAVRDTLAFCRQAFTTEMNSAVDNPLVFVHSASSKQSATGDIVSGGNFHGEPVAFALDYLAIALCALAGISERRVERMVNPTLSEGLPAFLASGAGLNSGFMMAQVTAAALASENKVYAHPASVDSITTSGNKEDYVSMGMAAALKLKKIVANTRYVLAIEAMAAVQAIDFLRPLKSSESLERAYTAIRGVSPFVNHDRVLSQDFQKIADLISSGVIAKISQP